MAGVLIDGASRLIGLMTPATKAAVALSFLLVLYIWY